MSRDPVHEVSAGAPLLDKTNPTVKGGGEVLDLDSKPFCMVTVEPFCFRSTTAVL